MNNRDNGTQTGYWKAVRRAFELSVGTVSVSFQSIFSAGTPLSGKRRVTSIEALARYYDPNVGHVAPDQFFEHMGADQCFYFASNVREQALTAFASVRGFMPTARLALNLSCDELLRLDRITAILQQITSSTVPENAVEFEISEKFDLSKMPPDVKGALINCRELGIRLVLDDFGTGFSGLVQLLGLPLDGVKIDKYFIQGFATDSRSFEVVRSTIGLAHRLGLDAVCEGIETEQQMLQVTDLGCDSMQGYFLANPLPADEYLSWVFAQQRDGLVSLPLIKPNFLLRNATKPPGEIGAKIVL